MNIRKMAKTDIPACSRLVKEAYAKPPYNETFPADSAERYIAGNFHCCEPDSFVVCNDEGAVIAFLFIAISAWSDGPQAKIEEIVVAPSHQRKGIGTMLLNHAYDYLREKGVNSVLIWAKTDERIQNFYRSQNFFPVDEFVVMAKELHG